MTGSISDQLAMERDRPKKASLIKIRFLIAVLATLCPVVCYISRQNLPFAIVSMVNDDDDDNNNDGQLMIDEQQQQQQHSSRVPSSALGDDMGLLYNSTFTAQRGLTNGSLEATTERPNQQLINQCPRPQATLDETGRQQATKGYGTKYAWSPFDKGFLLGAFFYTYVIFQIPGARLAESIGAKWILTAASLGSALLSFASPWAASIHVHCFSLVRLLMGVFQAALYPTCYVLYSRWLPPLERSQALPILCVGAYVGSIVASSLTGYFSEQPQFGWEWAFYVPGVMCSLWTLLWVLFAANEPREHASISIEELIYIESKMERQPNGSGEQRRAISWFKLFSSGSIWAMMAAFFASNWSFTIVLLLLPSYLNRILYVSPMNNGIINSIIYILYCIASPLVGMGSTMMVETRACGLSRLNIRKLFQGTALFGQALCFVLLPLMGCEQSYVFAVLFLQIILFSFVNGGEVQLPTELSVDFAGTIYAIGNCVGSSTGFIVPLVFSEIVRDELSRKQWDVYFYLAALISTIGGLIFVCFGQNKLQDFAKNVSESRANICELASNNNDNSNDERTLAAKSMSFNLEEALPHRRPNKTIDTNKSSFKVTPN